MVVPENNPVAKNNPEILWGAEGEIRGDSGGNLPLYKIFPLKIF